MTVRTICVSPGQMLQAGDRVAELLEPSGRWVSIVATELPGQIKAVRLREGDILDAPSEICAIYTMRRPKPDEDPPLGLVTRMSLEDLQSEEYTTSPAVPRAPIRPLSAASPHTSGGHNSPESPGLLSFISHHKLAFAATFGVFVVALGIIIGASFYQNVTEQPHLSMDTLWSEMRKSQISAADAHHATGDDAFASGVVAQKRALKEARDHAHRDGACAGMYIGMELPGLHVTHGVRRITYLDNARGVGTFVWNKSLEADTFACASLR